MRRRPLGLEVSESPRGLELRLAKGGTIFVYPKAHQTPASFTVLNFQVDDIGQAVDTLGRIGVHPEIYDESGIKTDERGIFTDRGLKIAWFKDPAGNVLSIIEDT